MHQELVENAENRMDVLQRETNLLPHIFDTLKHPDSRVRAEFIGHCKPCVTEIYLRKLYLMRARPIISTLGHNNTGTKAGGVDAGKAREGGLEQADHAERH